MTGKSCTSPTTFRRADQFQFLYNIRCAAKFVDAPQFVAHIHADGPVEILSICHLMAERFVVAVETKPDRLSTCIKYRSA